MFLCTLDMYYVYIYIYICILYVPVYILSHVYLVHYIVCKQHSIYRLHCSIEPPRGGGRQRAGGQGRGSPLK